MNRNIQKVLYYINLVILASLILSYISPLIDPSNFWPIAFFGLFFPIIISVNLLFIIYWYFLNKKWMIINLFFVFCSIPYLNRYLSINILENSNTEKRIKIMSYNVRLFNSQKWIKQENIQKRISEFVNNNNLDILCIQEYYNPDDSIKLDFKFSSGGDEMKSNWKMAIYSNYPQINSGTLSVNGEKMGNSCIYADIKINNQIIRVYNIHLASNFFSKSDRRFLKSPEVKKGAISILKRLKRSFLRRSNEVKSIKDHMKESPYPIIICGDFNDTPVSYAYNQLLKNKKDAFRESGNGIQSTYTKIPALRIDYILYDNKFDSKNFHTYDEILSDHKAISCEIGVN